MSRASLPRRWAILAAVASSLALSACAARAGDIIGETASAVLADLHRLPKAGEPAFNEIEAAAVTRHAGDLLAVLARTPATDRRDLVWKAGVVTVADGYDVDNLGDLALSVARDVVRLDGGAQ